jgi:endonuclease YncB( thermonuclease family)
MLLTQPLGRLRLPAFVLVLAAFGLLPAGHGQEADDTPPKVPIKDFARQPAYEVLGVTAGNEFVVRLDGQETAIRLIGTYVPQSGSDADAARAFAGRLLAGEAVYLEYEPSWPQRDREERVWAYVYRAPEGLFVNLELIRQGYARVSGAEPFAHQALLRSYERLAQRHHKGLWSPRPAREATSQPVVAASAPAPLDDSAADEVLVYITEHGRKYHNKDCQYVRNGGIAVTLKEARARGCSPCARCKPPQ